jgi:starch synthase
LQSTKRLNILILAAEVAPFAKVGGLADVAGALPKALKELGHDVRVAMPCYRMIEDNPAYAVQECLPGFPVPSGQGKPDTAFVKRTRIRSAAGDIPVYLVGNAPAKRGKKGYFEEAVGSTSVYVFAVEPYAFFARAVLEMLPRISQSWVPDVIHCNDWHTGLLPVYQHELYADRPVASSAATLFSIHNLAYQGTFPKSCWNSTGLPESLFSFDKLEFYGQWSFMKAGLTYSDRVNTVSENYAKEIETAEFGCGLEGMMRWLSGGGRLSGILNGIDFEEFNPETDTRIPANYSALDLKGKAKCKAELQRETGLIPGDAMVIGMVTRLAEQKGFDLIASALEPLLAQPIQLVLLGTGDREFEKLFKRLQTQRPGQVYVKTAFDPDLAQRIYAGSDTFLMPSRFEPCGLGQLISLRYGTVPIVRTVGGLADTVTDVSSKSQAANGFTFSAYTPEAMMATIQRAVDLYSHKRAWKTVVVRGMKQDWSWSRSAKRYEALYAEAIAARAEASGAPEPNAVAA